MPWLLGRAAGVLEGGTYYSDDWVVNFWNSESGHMEEELAQIRADGFNSIILAVPWKEFQPMNGPGQLGYEEYAYEKLNRVFETAQRQGLWVFLRVGYTWDYGGGSMTSSRHEALLYDENMRQAWLAYVESLYLGQLGPQQFCRGISDLGGFLEFSCRTREMAGMGSRVSSWRKPSVIRTFSGRTTLWRSWNSSLA